MIARQSPRPGAAAEARMMPATSTIDVEDMRKVCEGSEQAFRQVVLRHQHTVLTYCIRFVGNTIDAQDITQDVFLTVWQQRKRYQEQGKLKFYLLKIARLRSLAHLKKGRAAIKLAKRVRAQLAARSAFVEGLPEHPDDLQKAISRLPAKHRDILILRHFEELDLEEIRTVTGLRIGTIKSRLHRGLRALRMEMQHVK